MLNYRSALALNHIDFPSTIGKSRIVLVKFASRKLYVEFYVEFLPTAPSNLFSHTFKHYLIPSGFNQLTMTEKQPIEHNST